MSALGRPRLTYDPVHLFDVVTVRPVPTLPHELASRDQGDVSVQQGDEQQEGPVPISERRKTLFTENGICFNAAGSLISKQRLAFSKPGHTKG